MGTPLGFDRLKATPGRSELAAGCTPILIAIATQGVIIGYTIIVYNHKMKNVYYQ